MLEVYGKTDRGNVRENNEDRICYPRVDTTSPPPKPEAGQLLIVADGVGGSQAGEHASNLTVETLKRIYYYGDHTQDPRWLLEKAIATANQDVLKLTQSNPTLQGAASTVTAAVVKGNQLYVANVGDSRTYLIPANGRCQQITKDHSLTQQKLDRGLIRPEQSKMDVDSHIITRSIGLDPGIEVDLFPARSTPAIALQPGDAILLCSDGLTDLVLDEEIARIVTRNHPKQAVQQLISLAKRKGGHDNISAIVGRMPGGPPPARLAWLPTPASVFTNRWLWLALGLALVGGLLWAVWPVVRPQGTLFRSVTPPASLVTRAPSPTTVATALLAAPSTPANATPVTEPTATRMVATATPEAAVSAQLTPMPTSVALATNAPLQTLPATVTPDVSKPELLEPAVNFSISGNGKTTFIWRWREDLHANLGFQVSMSLVGKPNEMQGLHDAKDTTAIQHDAPGIYHLSLDVASLRGNGDYAWTVAVVRLDPYEVLATASPRPIKINIASGGGGGHRDNNSNNPGGAATRGP